MISVANEPLVALRWQAFKETFPIEGVDLADATLKMQLRLYPDAPGDPVLSLDTAASPTEGLSVSVVTTEGMPTSTIEVRINETTIEGLLPFPGNGLERGQPVTLAYDMHITAAGFPKHRWFEGTFTIKPGATH